MHYWLKVKDYPLEVTKDGLVRNIKTFKIITPGLDTKGYLQVPYNGKTVKLHKLLAIAFISNLDNKPQVNHKDGNKQNNSLDNLEWVTASENVLHSYRVLKRGLKNKRGKKSKKLKGATFSKKSNRWHSRIVVDQKTISLGYFNTKEEAAKAYNEAALKYHTNPVLNEV